MIISMSDILCVTNRSLCKEDFLIRVEKVAAEHPKGIILREKDLSEEAYKTLAEKVLNCCKKYDVPCILHSFVDIASELGAENIHLPLHVLRGIDEKKKEALVVVNQENLSLAIGKKGLNVNYQNDKGNTILHHIIKCDYSGNLYPIYILLMNNGFDDSIKNNDDMTVIALKVFTQNNA